MRHSSRTSQELAEDNALLKKKSRKLKTDEAKYKQAENELHKSQDRLKLSEERYRNILDSIEEAYYEVDLKGNFTFFNAPVAGHLGYTKEEVLGMNYRQYIDSGYVEKVFEAFNKVFLTGKSIKINEWVLKTKSGGKLPVEGSVSLMRDALGKPVGFKGIIRDIIERKRAEESLRESEEKYRKILENIDDAYYEVNLHGNFVFFNKALVSKTGYFREELTGMNFKHLVSPDSQKQVREVFTDVYKTGQTARLLECTVIRKDGGRINVESWVSPVSDKKNRMIGFKGMARDVTARKQAEEKLRLSEEKFSKVFMMAPEMVAITRLADGLIADINRGFEEITGWKRSEVIGRSSLDLNFWIIKSQRDAMVEELKAGRDIRNREFPFRRKDGSIRDGIYSARSIQIAGEQCLIFVLQDVTDKTRLAEDRRKLEEILNRVEKMEAIGALAGGVAHDFNNMLGVILGRLEMAEKQVNENQPLTDHLVEIRKAAERSADLTRQLLAFARKQKISPKVLDINETIGSMLKMIRQIMGEDIQLAWLPGIHLWTVKMDPSQIDQILANLCVNARDAITGVGKVIIETENITLDAAGCIEKMGALPGDYILLTINDNGCGMSRETLNKLFEPFFTTKELGKGTGLGLATVYGIVKQNNGFINVHSQPNEGTSIKVYLPRHIGSVDQAGESFQQDPIMGGHETVLIVEDEESILSLCQLVLENYGYEVLTASTPEAAFRLAANHTGKIHLLITDVIMPQMNGRDLANKLTTLYPDLKCIFMSGYTANVIAHHGVLDSGVHFIQKPFSLQDLGTKVRAVLDQK